MPKNYQVVHTNDKKPLPKSLDIAKFLAKDGQVLLPMLDLLTNAECALDDLIHTMGRATIEAILLMSAAEVAGPKQQGKKTDRDIAYHGKQGGRVMLKERQLQVSKPRLRHRNPKPGESGEVEIPAYQVMNSGDATLADRMLQIIMAGVSTRKYSGIIPEMAHTVGVSKSQISRATIEAGEEVLKALAEKTFHDLEIVAVWIDGIQIGDYNVVCAVGVDISGEKHVLGVRQGATENAEVVKPLLEDLVARGLNPSQRRLFVLDGAKALRCAVNAVFGDDAKVQRCRNHKIRNVVGHLPKDQKDQARLTMKAGFRLGGKQGKAKLEQYAKWLERDQPGAAASLREGLDEMFTIDDLGLPPMLKRCLGTTNIIDNSHSAARQKIHRVTNWQSGDMAVRWTASALVSSSKNFRKVMGYKDLWMLKANLQPNEQNLPIAEEVKVG